MARLLSGGRANGIANITRTVSGSGVLLNLPRLLGAGSQLSLQTGSDANLSLSGVHLQAAAPLAAGEAQIARIREFAGEGADERVAEYTLTLKAGLAAPVAGTALPAMSKLAGAYGLGKLVADYAGPALRVRRVSDGAEVDIGFVGQALDADAAAAFQSSSSLRLAVVYDQSGTGRHLTQLQASSQPQLWLGEGGPTITNYDTDCPLMIPPSLVIRREDCAVFMVARTPGQAATCGYWAFGTGTAEYGLTSARTAGNLAIQPMVSGASVSSANTNAQALGVANMSVLGLVSSTAGQVAHRDEQQVHYPPAGAARLDGGGEVGEAIEYGGRTDWRAFIVYSSAPDEAEVAQVRQTLRTVFGTSEPVTLSFLGAGDSIVFGTGGAHNRTITAAMHHRSAPGVLFRNIGIAGHRLGQHCNDFDTASAAYIVPDVPNVFFANYGHNDIKNFVLDDASAISTVEAMKGQASHMAARLRAYGFDMVIWQEAYADTTFTPAQESARNAWNAWLRSEPTADDRLPCFDAVDRVASDAAFVLSDAETAAGRGMALTVNSSDGVHPNEVHAGVRAARLLTTYEGIPFALKYIATPAQQGLPYAGYRPAVVKGVSPFTFTLAPRSAPLPLGLSLDPATGVIAGIPTQAAEVSGLVLQATDRTGATAEASFTLSVAAAPEITVIDQTESWTASDGTAVPVMLPQEVMPGDVLVAVLSVDGTVSIAWDDATAGGWVQRAVYAANSNQHLLAIFTRRADGMEGGQVLNVELSAPQQAVARVLRVRGASGAAEVSAYARGNAMAADPPLVTPGWTGASLYIAAMALDGTAVVTSGPAGFSGFATRASSANGQSTNATAWALGSGPQNAEPFTTSAAANWVTATLALQAA